MTSFMLSLPSQVVQVKKKLNKSALSENKQKFNTKLSKKDKENLEKNNCARLQWQREMIKILLNLLKSLLTRINKFLQMSTGLLRKELISSVNSITKQRKRRPLTKRRRVEQTLRLQSQRVLTLSTFSLNLQELLLNSSRTKELTCWAAWVISTLFRRRASKNPCQKTSPSPRSTL